MTNLITTLFLIFATQLVMFSQNNLEERTNSADLVVEGRIIQKESFWNFEKTAIFTKNTLEVSKIFKGERNLNHIEIITKGGIVENDFQLVTHTFQLQENTEGIFFLKNALPFGSKSFWVRGIPNPLINYIPNKKGFVADDGNKKYENPVHDIYNPITAATDKPFTEIRKNTIELKIEKWLNEVVKIETVTNDILIEFSFQNIQLTGTELVEFDIVARTNQAGIKLATSDIYIEYSTQAFGENVVVNDKIEATKETIIENNIYTLQLADESQQIVKFLVNAGLEPNELFPLSSFFEKFLHIKLDIQNLWSLAELSFEDFLMSNQSFFYDEIGRTFVGFDKIAVSNPVFPFLVPNIISIAPNPVTAGTNTYLTITGDNFGVQNNDSKVLFKNANWFVGSTHPEWSEVYTNNDITNWQDDEITVLIPDFMQNAGTGNGNGTAGTGRIVVVNSFGADTSDQILDVKYNVRNVRFTDENFIDEYRVEIKRQNSASNDFGITWRVSQALTDEDNLVLTIIQDAILQWRCETDVSWNFNQEPLAQNFNSAVDGVNLIYLAPSGDFSDPDFIAETFVSGRLGICSAENTIYINEVDIAIKDQDFIFGYAMGTDPIFLDRKDFYSTILHELGHSLMLQHARPYGKVMFPTILSGSTTERIITVDDSDGAKNVLQSSQNNLGINGCPTSIDKHPCLLDGITDEIKMVNDILIFPNPFGSNVSISLNSEEMIDGKIKVFNMIGQLILEEQIQIFHGENSFNIELDMNIPKGGYYLQIQMGTENVNSKIIKQ